ncbi:MAG: OmpA family protein, partial [Myxococcaceae bacterium]
APAPAPAPAPAARAKKEDKAAATTVPAAARRVKEPVKAAPETPADPAPVIVSTEEKLVPGSEPHSPSTWNNRWNDRRNHRLAPGAMGPLGLAHVSSAEMGPRGILRLSVFGEYLNQGDFPVRDATNVRSAGTFAVSFVPLPWLEAYLSYGASANSNSFSSPTLIQALGDLSLGAKVSREWARGLHAGVDLRVMSFSGVGNQDVGRYAFGFAPRLLTTYDVSTAVPELPLLIHANAGFHFDGTGSLVNSHTLNASEEFALRVNEYDRFVFGLGVEVPLTAVTPFLEYNLGYPIGVERGVLFSPNGRDQVLVAAAMPQTIGGGIKVTAIKDLTLALGADFGLSRTVGLGVPATPPWNLYFGAAFNIDPFQRGESRVVETVREVKVDQKVVEAPKTSRIEGVIIDAQTQKPISGVIIAAVGAGAPPVASDKETGRFLTHDLPPGAIKLAVVKDGYQELTHEVALVAGETKSVQVLLEPKAKLAHFVISVVDAKKKPVPAKVVLKGPKEETVETGAEASKLDVPPGKYLVNVVADEYLAQTREVQVSEDAEMKLAFELEPQPKKKLVVVKNDKIEILQQVHFTTGKSTILADSYSLLNQVVDAIVKSNVKRVRIEGHTDNRGSKKKNLSLSEQRARAVADYLIKQGIDPSRIESAGFGPDQPIAPNLTARGRELNRRVEFVILDR